MPGVARHTPQLAGNRAVRLLVIDAALLPHVGEAIGALSLESEWVEIEDSVSDVVDSAMASLLAYYANLMVGSVSSWMFSPPPPGWLALDGTTYDKADYPELWEVLPDGLKSASDFTLPDMAEQFQAGTNTESEIGDQAGDNSFALTVGQLPTHSHLYTPPSLTIEAETPTTPLPTAGIGTPTQTGTTGNGDVIDNRPEHVLFSFAVYAGRE